MQLSDPHGMGGLTCPRCHGALVPTLAHDTSLRLHCAGCRSVEAVPRRAPSEAEALSMERALHARRSHVLL